VEVADDVAGLGQGELAGFSFLCASMDLHWTVTVIPGEGDGVTVVVGVRLMIHVPDAQGNFISDPDCTTIVLAFIAGSTVPLIWSVCPNATAPNKLPATTANSKILVFMLPLNRENQHSCKFLLVRSLGE
jgi:hypothetical protein